MTYFLRRATLAALAAGALAVAGIVVLRVDAPILADELARRGWPLVLASVVLGTAALVPCAATAPRGTRVLAVGAVVAIVWGWGVAQYPDILPGSLSLADAAAPPGSLGALLIVFVVAALVIAPSLALLYFLDQRSRLVSHGLETGATTIADVPGTRERSLGRLLDVSRRHRLSVGGRYSAGP